MSPILYEAHRKGRMRGFPQGETPTPGVLHMSVILKGLFGTESVRVANKGLTEPGFWRSERNEASGRAERRRGPELMSNITIGESTLSTKKLTGNVGTLGAEASPGRIL